MSDPDLNQSQPGEPIFGFGTADVGAGQFVAVTIQSGNGVMVQLVLRPDLALTVARLLSEQAKLARSGLVIAGNGDIPKPLEGL
jgi:hypothetical protein